MGALREDTHRKFFQPPPVAQLLKRAVEVVGGDFPLQIEEVELTEDGHRGARLLFQGGGRPPGCTKKLYMRGSLSWAFAEIHADVMNPVRVQHDKRLRTSLFEGASLSDLVAHLKAQADIVQPNMLEERSVPMLSCTEISDMNLTRRRKTHLDYVQRKVPVTLYHALNAHHAAVKTVPATNNTFSPFRGAMRADGSTSCPPTLKPHAFVQILVTKTSPSFQKRILKSMVLMRSAR